MHSLEAESIVSITRCLGRTLPPGGASLLPSASTWRDFPGADTSIGDASAPSDLSSCCSATCLASRRCQSVPCIKGRMRSETMFQWSLDSGLRFTTIFWPCVSSWGILSSSYSNMGEMASPKKWGNAT